MVSSWMDRVWQSLAGTMATCFHRGSEVREMTRSTNPNAKNGHLRGSKSYNPHQHITLKQWNKDLNELKRYGQQLIRDPFLWIKIGYDEYNTRPIDGYWYARRKSRQSWKNGRAKKPHYMRKNN